MDNYSIPQSERYINPNRVNTSRPIRIFSTDPRNNPAFLKENPFTTIIDIDNSRQLDVDNEIGYSSDPDPFQFPENPIVLPPDGGTDGPSQLPPPTGLSIDSFELKISGDGTIYYIATLSFNDVDNASGYEYSLEEIVT